MGDSLNPSVENEKANLACEASATPPEIADGPGEQARRLHFLV
jgi:hypothetical protein